MNRHPRTRKCRVPRVARGLACCALLCACGLARADPDAPPSVTPAPAEPDPYDTAKQLFDELAPPEVKEQYDFPSREQFDAFAKALQRALDGDSFDDLAKYEPEAQELLAVLRASPDTAGYADWLAARIDELEVARSIAREQAAHPTPPPSVHPTPPAAEAIPYYGLWYRRMSRRPEPPGAGELMPRLRAAFSAEGAPPDLAWLAEVESSLNPNASNPSGARGLFQLKASTAKSMGLSTFLPDERTDPDKSARAAARLLVTYRDRFGSWPLAIAAYNAGEGRVARALASRHANSYAQIASALSAGTRIYVPEVCALVAARTGHTL